MRHGKCDFVCRTIRNVPERRETFAHRSIVTMSSSVLGSTSGPTDARVSLGLYYRWASLGRGMECITFTMRHVIRGRAYSGDYLNNIPINCFKSSSSDIIVSSSGTTGTSVATASRRVASFVISVARMV